MLDRWTSLLDDRFTRRNATVTVWRAVSDGPPLAPYDAFARTQPGGPR